MRRWCTDSSRSLDRVSPDPALIRGDLSDRRRGDDERVHDEPRSIVGGNTYGGRQKSAEGTVVPPLAGRRPERRSERRSSMSSEATMNPPGGADSRHVM